MYKKITLSLVTLSLTGCMFGETSIQKADSASTAPTLPACTSDNAGNCSISVANKTLLEPNLIAANITNGISIFGVTGTAVIPSPCTNDNAGSCRITQANKTLLEPNLVAGNIRTGTTVFGVTGTLPVYASCINDNNGNCAIPGANKTGIEPNLLATNIMNGVTVFGVTGTYQGPTPCTNDNGGSCRITQANKTLLEPNLVAGNIQNGVSVFGVTGTYQGPSPCTNDNAGSCRITQANKTLLEANLIAANIKSGITIFGVLGSYTGSGVGSMASNMFRDPATTQISILTESTTNAGVQYSNDDPGYRAIPDINKDDDGYTGGSVTYVDRSTWATTTCGTVQATLNARIADCATVFGTNATWDGPTKGNAGQAVWKLVTRTGGNDPASNRAREVWRDERTGLLWSSLVSGGDRNANWCKASGSNQIPGNPAAKDDPSDYCDLAGGGSYQNTAGLAISACFEDGGVNFTDVDADLDPAGKGNLSRASAPAVSWRLPTINDYHVSEADGIRFVMPEMGPNSFGYEWSSSVYSGVRNVAWVFNSVNGDVSGGVRSNNDPVRCVGR